MRRRRDPIRPAALLLGAASGSARANRSHVDAGVQLPRPVSIFVAPPALVMRVSRRHRRWSVWLLLQLAWLALVASGFCALRAPLLARQTSSTPHGKAAART